MQEDSLFYEYFIPKPPLSRCENLLMYTNTFFNFLKGSCQGKYLGRRMGPSEDAGGASS